MTYLLFAFLAATAFGYECTIQTDFYRSLPVFLGTTGTMEISTENILVLTNRGTGVQTETKANITRYFYPAERIEAHIYRTLELNGDVTVTTTPKFFIPPASLFSDGPPDRIPLEKVPKNRAVRLG